MIIKSINYWHYPEKPQSWKVDNCLLDSRMNLIVAKNASGKTRFLNIISNLAALLAGRQTQLFSSGNWEVIFENNKNEEIKYCLHIEDHKIQEEIFTKDKKVLLQRKSSGEGKIWADEIEREISFQIGTLEIAALKKSDSLQHSFLNDLSEWASNLYAYPFAGNFGKNIPFFTVEHATVGDLLPTNNEQQNQVVAFYNAGKAEFGDVFVEQVKKDMGFIGYDLEWISVESVKQVKKHIQENAQSLHIKESDLNFKIPQHEISQGMFRALSLIIHLNYLKLSSSSQCCVLIDDIGEGLDFARSSKLIQLILEKFSLQDTRYVQIIMTSNDRFVMNGIPLEYWLLIERMPKTMKFFSKRNSPEIFEEFEFTGLNNFDFLASEYFKG